LLLAADAKLPAFPVVADSEKDTAPVFGCFQRDSTFCSNYTGCVTCLTRRHPSSTGRCLTTHPRAGRS